MFNNDIVGVDNSVNNGATLQQLGLYVVAVAAVDAEGHESLFAYPEYRCDSAGCAVQAGSLNLTAMK
jgi:hypothetical protein